MLRKLTWSINEPIQFYACYKNQVDFYKVQKSSRFLVKSYKNWIGFYGCYKNQVDFCP